MPPCFPCFEFGSLWWFEDSLHVDKILCPITCAAVAPSKLLVVIFILVISPLYIGPSAQGPVSRKAPETFQASKAAFSSFIFKRLWRSVYA